MLAQRGIGIAQGLVEEDLGLEHERAKRHAPLLPAESRPDSAPRSPLRTVASASLTWPIVAPLYAEAAARRQIFEHGLVRPDGVALEHHRERALLGRHHEARRCDRLAGDADGARLRPVEPRDQAQQRRLATSTRAEQDDGLAVLDLQRDAVDGDDVAEATVTSSISSYHRGSNRGNEVGSYSTGAPALSNAAPATIETVKCYGDHRKCSTGEEK
jgi:hypothetical protein